MKQINRIKKALVAAGSAAATAIGLALAEGQDWRAVLGYAAGAAMLAGGTTYLAKNKPGAAELRRAAEEAVREGRP